MKKLLILLLFLSYFAYGQVTVPKTFTASGTNTYTITESFPATYTTNENFYVRFTNGNTGAVTLNRATLGDKAIQKAGAVALVSGDIVAGGTYLLNYNGTYYQIVGDGGGGGGGSGDMILASTQTNTGAKTFLDNTLLMRNVGNTFNSKFTNTNTAARTYTLPDFSGTLVATFGITNIGTTPIQLLGTNAGNDDLYFTLDNNATQSNRSWSLGFNGQLNSYPASGNEYTLEINSNRIGWGSGGTYWFEVNNLTATINKYIAIDAKGLNFRLNVGSDAIGDTYQRNASGYFDRLPSVATGNALISGGIGTVNSWGKIGLTTHVTGTLPVANGGTNRSALGTSLQVLRTNAAATDTEWATVSAGSGTVTNTGGNLTSNSVILGAGTVDTKVVAGITTNGTAQLVLGVNTTTLGSVKMFGNTSGDVTIQPSAVAGTGVVLTLPSVTGSILGGVITSPVVNQILQSDGTNWINRYYQAPVSVQSGTTYTLVAADQSSVIYFTATTPITVTLPNGLANNFSCVLVRKGAGTGIITLVATTTLESDGTTIEVQHTGVEVIHRTANVWTAMGSLGAPLTLANITGVLPVASGGTGVNAIRKYINAEVVATNANVTATYATTYVLPAATISANRTIDMTALNTNGDYIEISNNEAGFNWSFTGQAVYLGDNVTTVTNLLTDITYQIRRINGKLKIIN